jgi:hypothetical protein
MARTRILEFVNDCTSVRRPVSPLDDFWRLGDHEIPASGGAYILVASETFLYPGGRSRVFYIGQSTNLRWRLRTHLRYSRHVQGNQRVSDWLYWPRYEYAGKFGVRYAYVQTHNGMTSRAVEEELMASFAHRYLAFPVANGSGSWKRITKHFTV